MLKIEDFRAELTKQLRSAESNGLPFLDINSGELHRTLGDYPNPTSHRMPICCDAMYGEQRSGDEIVSQPPGGKGASLTIRYQLPR